MVAGVALVLVSAGCVQASPDPAPTPAPQLYLAVAASVVPDGIGPQAGYDGILALTDEGCFGLAVSPTLVQPTIFPADSTIAADGSGITVPGVGDIRLGQRITGQGGEFEIAPLDDLIPPQCEAETMTLLTPYATP
jgi:hypothetical protein